MKSDFVSYTVLQHLQQSFVMLGCEVRLFCLLHSFMTSVTMLCMLGCEVRLRPVCDSVQWHWNLKSRFMSDSSPWQWTVKSDLHPSVCDSDSAVCNADPMAHGEVWFTPVCPWLDGKVLGCGYLIKLINTLLTLNALNPYSWLQPQRHCYS